MVVVDRVVTIKTRSSESLDSAITPVRPERVEPEAPHKDEEVKAEEVIEKKPAVKRSGRNKDK